MVVDSGNGNRCRVHVEIGGEKFVYRGKDGYRVFGGDLGGAGGVGLDGSDKSDAEPGGFQLTVDAEVVAAKGACSGNGDAENGLARYFATSVAGSLPSTALRQRL